jgi:hypothetical protein
MSNKFFTITYCRRSGRLVEHPTSIGMHWYRGTEEAHWHETRGRHWRERRARPNEGIGPKAVSARFHEHPPFAA